MKISQDKVVSLVYELRLNGSEGEVVESLNESNPLTFVYGQGRLLPKFEENIEGLIEGDAFEFDLAAGYAYGEINHDAIVTVPLAAFEIDGKVDYKMLEIGNTIPMQDSAGNKLNGRVKSVDDSNVTMDFNHPMAGNDLFFKGQVVGIREARPEELQAHSCGCGSGGCGSGCESDGHEHGGGCGDGCGCN